jgi:hypothetical protein
MPQWYPYRRKHRSDSRSFVEAVAGALTVGYQALSGELDVQRLLDRAEPEFEIPNVTGKRAVWPGLDELDRSLVNLNAQQLSTVETVVVGWGANGWSSDPMFPFVVNDFEAGLNGGFVVACPPMVSAATLASDWYRWWLFWTKRAISHGVSTKQILQAIRRRKSALRAKCSPRSVRTLQRVMTELQRVRRVLRPHAPPGLAQSGHTAEGLSAA